MRFSVEKGDPGFAAYRALGPSRRKVRVFVDGVEQKECVTADTKRGVAVIHQRDAAGWLAINRRRDRLKLQQVFGRVEFTFD